MKLKEIKPRMVIHCKTEQEAKKFLGILSEMNFKWCDRTEVGEDRTSFDEADECGLCYYVNDSMKLEYARYGYFASREEYGEIIPFYSLIIEENTYDDGLNDAWDFIRKIYDLKCDDIEKIFNTNGGVYGVISSTVPIKDMIAKLEAYEAEKQIKVGDVVMHTKTQFVVTCVEDGFIRGIDKLGGTNCYVYPNSLIKKTGKHIDISSVLAEIGKE